MLGYIGKNYLAWYVHFLAFIVPDKGPNVQGLVIVAHSCNISALLVDESRQPGRHRVPQMAGWWIYLLPNLLRPEIVNNHVLVQELGDEIAGLEIHLKVRDATMRIAIVRILLYHHLLILLVVLVVLVLANIE